MTDDSDTPQNDPLDDWDLDDDELSLGESIKPTPIGIPERKTVELDSLGTRPVPQTPPEPTATPPARPAAPPPADQSSPPTPTPEPRPSKPPREKEKTGGRPSTITVIEKIALVIVTLALLGTFTWIISTYLSDPPEGELVEFTTDFPVSGQKVVIQSVETWWREPVTTGDDIDVGVVIDTELIPCAKIVLESGSSTTLQASFRDGEGKLIGDTLNLVVQNGKFAKSDSPEITIHGTAGFFNASQINPYVNGDIDPWSLIIVEADDPDTEVVKARVSKTRLEN